MSLVNEPMFKLPFVAPANQADAFEMLRKYSGADLDVIKVNCGDKRSQGIVDAFLSIPCRLPLRLTGASFAVAATILGRLNAGELFIVENYCVDKETRRYVQAARADKLAEARQLMKVNPKLPRAGKTAAKKARWRKAVV